MSVLYVDHAGRPAPLSLTYHATASRHLTSTSTSSLAVEVDSAHCPQCLSYYDAFTASGSPALRGRCPRPHCRLCPSCECPLAVTCEELPLRGLDDAGGDDGGSGSYVCLYRCGHCRWDSKRCGLVSSPTPSPPTDSAAVASAAEELGRRYAELTGGEGSKGSAAAADELFGQLCRGWNRKVQADQRNKRLGDKDLAAATAASLRIIPKRDDDAGEEEIFTTTPSQFKAWSVETLERSMERKQSDARARAVASVLPTPLSSLSTDTPAGTTQAPIDHRGVVSIEQATAQGVVRPEHPRGDPAELLPMRIPLRARKSKRCRAELARGKPGILVKPKPNPLEGDSSLRSGHGQWWKKDCSAVHVVPRLNVVSYGAMNMSDAKLPDSSSFPSHPSSIDSIHALLLKVHNPTLGVVRLRFTTSAALDSLDVASFTATDEERGRTPLLRNVRLSPYEKVFADLQLFQPDWLVKEDIESKGSNENHFPSHVIELDAAQDALLEMAHNKSKAAVGADDASLSSRERVSKWNASTAMDEFIRRKREEVSSQSESSNALVTAYSFREFARENDSSWIEFIFAHADDEMEQSGDTASGYAPYLAVPMAMQIEIGNGSWEASLVAPDVSKGTEQCDKNEERDFCTFDLIVVCSDDRTDRSRC